MIKVWHANSLRFMDPISFPADYRAVAEVDTNTPGRAFEATNHIDRDWTDNPDVKTLVTGGVRSTSVGDVLEVGPGDFEIVMPFGFKSIEPGPVTFEMLYGTFP